MGAWGHGYFEDDTALDFMVEIEDAASPKQVISAALDAALSAEYLEEDKGNAVIVAAIYADRQLNGTLFSSPDDEEPMPVDTFPERHPETDFVDLREKIVKALHRVLGEHSELHDLWAENEEDYPAWRQGVEQLILRLTV